MAKYRELEDGTVVPIKQSRWVKDSDVPRYTQAQNDYIVRHYREEKGWFRAARVRPYGE